MVNSVGGKLVWGGRNKHTRMASKDWLHNCGILKELKALVRHSL